MCSLSRKNTEIKNRNLKQIISGECQAKMVKTAVQHTGCSYYWKATFGQAGVVLAKRLCCFCCWLFGCPVQPDFRRISTKYRNNTFSLGDYQTSRTAELNCMCSQFGKSENG